MQAYIYDSVTALANDVLVPLLSTHADGQGVDISFTVCLCFVCLFVRFGFLRRG